MIITNLAINDMIVNIATNLCTDNSNMNVLIS